jgi:hypothetical protein
VTGQITLRRSNNTWLIDNSTALKTGVTTRDQVRDHLKDLREATRFCRVLLPLVDQARDWMEFDALAEKRFSESAATQPAKTP